MWGGQYQESELHRPLCTMQIIFWWGVFGCFLTAKSFAFNCLGVIQAANSLCRFMHNYARDSHSPTMGWWLAPSWVCWAAWRRLWPAGLHRQREPVV